ncbi:hypothetical protein BN1708_020397, partial [Verticillium longisporum]
AARRLPPQGQEDGQAALARPHAPAQGESGQGRHAGADAAPHRRLPDGAAGQVRPAAAAERRAHDWHGRAGRGRRQLWRRRRGGAHGERVVWR